ncbi:MAG: hypothetical protein OXQ84_17735 [bacterium]|nr:hypothetical protein [bacterium]
MHETVGRGAATREDIRHLEDRIDKRIDKLDERIDKFDNRLWLLLATVLVSAVAVIFKGSA